HLHRHLDHCHGGAVVALKGTLKLPQHNAFDLAYLSVVRSFLDRDLGRHRLPNQRLKILAAFVSSFWIARHTRFKTRRQGRLAVANGIGFGGITVGCAINASRACILAVGSPPFHRTSPPFESTSMVLN